MAHEQPTAWQEAVLAARLLAVDPVGIAGVVVRSPAGPVRDRWQSLLRALLPERARIRRVPLHAADDRLIGGLDIAATLAAGRPVCAPGLLAEADGGVILIAGAERLAADVAARITATMDTGNVVVARDGFETTIPSRFAVVALDEGDGGEERLAGGLLDRIGLGVDLSSVALGQTSTGHGGEDEIMAARERLARVHASEEVVTALCATALALGVGSLRGPVLALRVARAAAALAGRDAIGEQDAQIAARLVLAPRATCLPAAEMHAEPSSEESGQTEGAAAGEAGDGFETASTERVNDLTEVLVGAAAAVVPQGLLAGSGADRARMRSPRTSGRSGAEHRSPVRGRPAGVRTGVPGGRARLAVVDTLRAAAPWQRLRRAARAGEAVAGDGARVQVRRDDFRIARYKHRAETTTIFVVDASGSSALHRLGEAKGAVELLLADCYVRRDSVALVAFRGATAEVLLAPTRSLARVKRSLAGLPGGGGTPLAAGLELGRTLADAVARKGQTPSLVVLTDGRANVARSGVAGRDRAEEDARAVSRCIRSDGLRAVLIDTSPKPRPEAGRIAEVMGALYMPLPHADAASLSRAIRSASARGAAGR